MQKNFAALAMLAGLGLASASQANANLFVNGSFETPGCASNCILDTPAEASLISGWTTALSGVEYFTPSTYGVGAAADGSMVVDLANYTYSNGAIEQTIATTLGQTYDLSFFAGNSTYGNRTGDGYVKVTINGVTHQFDTAMATTSQIVWKKVDLSFQAIAASTTVRFWNDQDSYKHFAFIDNVSAVVAVPEPETYALMLVGLGLVGFMARRRKVATA